MGGFIVGFDNDKPSIFQRQIDFIQKSGIVTAMVGMLQAIPGTRLFERLQRESRVVNTFTGDNVDGTNNIIPDPIEVRGLMRPASAIGVVLLILLILVLLGRIGCLLEI